MCAQAVLNRQRGMALGDSGTEIPPELLLRRDQTIRYERGGTVYATDGRVGVLRRVIVSEEAGEVEDLVIEVDADKRQILVTPDLVDKTAGSAVFLTTNRTQFYERSASALLYEKAHFGRADGKAVVAKGADVPSNRGPRRAVANVGRDFVETPAPSFLERLERTAG
ncbi:MAG: hypothetical protein M3R06_06520 [Chloroflexota bacterium]|nr:hypothetical protein [Chloroflexota bacterium]